MELFAVVVAVLLADVLLLWAGVRTLLVMQASKAGKAWWCAALLFVLIGASAGIWCLFINLQVSDRLQVVSVPVPTVLLVLEDDRWVDYVSSFLPFSALLDLVTVFLLCQLPIIAAYPVFLSFTSVNSASTTLPSSFFGPSAGCAPGAAPSAACAFACASA